VSRCRIEPYLDHVGARAQLWKARPAPPRSRAARRNPNLVYTQINEDTSLIRTPRSIRRRDKCDRAGPVPRPLLGEGGPSAPGDCLTGTSDASNAREVRPAATGPCMAASSDRVVWRSAGTISTLITHVESPTRQNDHSVRAQTIRPLNHERRRTAALCAVIKSSSRRWLYGSLDLGSGRQAAGPHIYASPRLGEGTQLPQVL
jgi:hypothetical protein